jgi:hypothetical protein
MERGVYAQGWFARGYNYHPSLPPRRLAMVEDFAEYRGTLITWPSLGGGTISLAYLEAEAYGVVAPRYRQYGFLNDSEFLAECRARGVKPFGVVFSTQGWEFPVELNDDETEILAMNELRGAGHRGWIGLREFTQNRYPTLWAPFEKYFPDGLFTSRGDPVTDLFDDACGRDIHGEPLHADWLQVPEREHECRYMDINNPVWREYLKAIVRIQIDAGVDGVQFDEPDSPLSALRYGGCFCHDCVTGFAAFLAEQPRETLPADVGGRLRDFDYGAWLLAQGREGFDPADPDELGSFFVAYLRRRVAENFAELAGYARSYAASVGREVLVSANLYDAAPWTDPMAGVVDILVPEQRHTLYRQPGWMRFVAGFGGGRPVCISVNPYGGVVPELVPALRHGRSFDRYRVMLYEAAAMGVNLSVPYGAWMGARIEDAWWAPHEETVAVQNFLADNERLYGLETANRIAVVYSTESNALAQTLRSALQARIDPVTGRRGQTAQPVPFFVVAEKLGARARPFDTLVFHDGELRADDVTVSALAGYRRVVLPECCALTDRQLDAVGDYLDGGGLVSVVGSLGPAGARAQRILSHPGTLVLDGDPASVSAGELSPGLRQVTLGLDAAVAANIVRTATGYAVHIVNYEYDEDADATRPFDHVTLTVRLDSTGIRRAVLHEPGRAPRETPFAFHGDAITLQLGALGSYLVVELSHGD